MMFGPVTIAERLESMDLDARGYIEQCDANDIERALALRKIREFHRSLDASFVYKAGRAMGTEKILFLEQIGVIDEGSFLLRQPGVQEERRRRYNEAEAEAEVESVLRQITRELDADPEFANEVESQRTTLQAFVLAAPVPLLNYVFASSAPELLYLLHRCGGSTLGNPYRDDRNPALRKAMAKDVP